MNRLLTRKPPARDALDPKDPYRYGWRYVEKTRPDGSTTTEMVPLTFDDLLSPEEGDFVVNGPLHQRDLEYSHQALEIRFQDRADVVVLGNCRIAWGVKGVRPLGPDITVLFKVRHWLREATFRIAKEGGKPVCVMEITSPSTRKHDLGGKLDRFWRAGVQCYVILDRGPYGNDPLRLLGYRRGRKGWLELQPDPQGRLELPQLGLLLGVEDDRPWFYDPETGERLPDFAGALQQRDVARAAAQAEAQARAILEKRVQELEEQLRRQQKT